MRRPVINSGVPGWDGRKYERTAAGVSRTGTDVLREYTDITGSAMFKAFADYHEHQLPESAEEIEMGLMTLWAITQELRKRFELQVLTPSG